jgi:polyisoprenoid-binding protein YceI
MTQTKYELDPTHTTIAFSVRHMMVTRQRGQFQGVSGELVLDRDDITQSRVNATIDAASVDTHVKDRDTHLRSADFFDVDNHPKITFVSRSIERVSSAQLRVTGDLTIRGTTRSVALDAEPVSPESKDPFGVIKVGTSATTMISRKDFGLVWNAVLETGGVAVGDDIQLTLDLQFQRKP